jgi:hypothetical protein
MSQIPHCKPVLLGVWTPGGTHFTVGLSLLLNSFYPAFEGKAGKWAEPGQDEDVFNTLDVSLCS